MRAKDAVGRYGEDVAARHLREHGLEVLDRNWRCPTRRARHRRARRRRPRVRRGQDPQLGAASACPPRRHAPQGARGCRRWPARGWPSTGAPLRRPALRRHQRAAAAPRRRPGRAPARGVLMALGAARGPSRWSASQGHVVEVEADLAQGAARLHADRPARRGPQEARDRVRAAIVNSGEQWPQRRITVGLSPASLPKSGSGFDLALAGDRSARGRRGGAAASASRTRCCSGSWGSTAAFAAGPRRAAGGHWPRPRSGT